MGKLKLADIRTETLGSLLGHVQTRVVVGGTIIGFLIMPRLRLKFRVGEILVVMVSGCHGRQSVRS
jgi:hypothetical protein